MQLQPITNYSIRIVMELAKNTKMTVNELSSLLYLDRHTVLKVLDKLKKADIVSAIQGVAGGFELKKDINEITLFHIIEVMETTIKVNRCLEEDGYCSRNATKTCLVRPIYLDIQTMIETEFSKQTIYDLIKEGSENKEVRL